MSLPVDKYTTMLRAYQKLRFLVVDDFESFRLSVRQMLRSFGAEHLDTAANGKDAVQKCTYDFFDIVLCDYNLGDGKNGQQILEELRHHKLLRHTSIFILVTAEASRDIVMGAREQQPDSYITKPITKAVLQQRLDGLIEQREALYPINKQIDLENHAKAISLCLQMMPSLPRYKSWIIKTLGDLYLTIGDFVHAKKIYEDVLKAREIPWARFGMGRVLLKEEQFDEAVYNFEKLISQSPEFMEAYDYLAEALRRQGKAKQSQKILEDAIALSPKVVTRQRMLAEIATQNHDLSVALPAWRNTVKMSTYSIHDSPDNFLNLGRCLSDLSESDDPDTSKKYAEEALQTLQRMEKRFREDENAKLASLLIETRVHAGQGNQQAANKALRQAEELTGNLVMTADAGLEMARTLYSMNQAAQAETLLCRLAAQFENEPETLLRIEALMDEPVSLQKKIQARTLNREGISLFEQGHLDDAASVFEEALKLVPRHAALNLNLVQVLMKRMEKEGATPKVQQRCRACIEQVSYIPTQHRQYKRFDFLRRKMGNAPA